MLDANAAEQAESSAHTANAPTPKAVTSPPAQAAQPQLAITTSRQFSSWLAETNVSLVFTSYQSGKVFFVGHKPNQDIAIMQRNFQRCMGMAVKGDDLYLSSLYQVWKFKRYGLNKEQQGNQTFDCVYTPRTSTITADLDIHDMVVDKHNKLLFVNTLFSCIATLSEDYSFEPIWKPPFISKLAAEDRCHLNGLCLRDGEARYVTIASQTDIYDGWRHHQKSGGIVMDIQSNAILCDNLSMPHSPRWHQDKLWVLNSGTGYFGTIDEKAKAFEPITFCPGYLRGLSFINQYAVVGLSHMRSRDHKPDLELYANLEQHQAQTRCGLQVIDINTGDIRHWLMIEGYADEIYDVAVLPNIRQPNVIGIEGEEIRSQVVLAPNQAEVVEVN